MKGKIAIVLLGLALVFGMIAVSCDNEGFKEYPKEAESLVFYKTIGTTGNNRFLPADNVTGIPERMDPEDAWKALNVKSKKNTAGVYVVPKIAGKVGPQTDITFTEDEQKIVNYFSGLPILIDNPLAK